MRVYLLQYQLADDCKKDDPCCERKGSVKMTFLLTYSWPSRELGTPDTLLFLGQTNFAKVLNRMKKTRCTTGPNRPRSLLKQSLSGSVQPQLGRNWLGSSSFGTTGFLVQVRTSLQTANHSKSSHRAPVQKPSCSKLPSTTLSV